MPRLTSRKYQGNIAEDVSHQPSNAAPTPAKRRRQQTWRACERCRTRRVKCDNTRPCLQCRERGVSCTNTNARGERDLKSLPLALREIEKLKLRISDLESELAECKKPPG
ncbi:hypothetical protein TrVGV298_006361 [Trichoderma virens]|nr:hypothetical protein TrVGV298_006361 [Trichoderma virens]